MYRCPQPTFPMTADATAHRASRRGRPDRRLRGGRGHRLTPARRRRAGRLRPVPASESGWRRDGRRTAVLVDRRRPGGLRALARARPGDRRLARRVVVAAGTAALCWRVSDRALGSGQRPGQGGNDGQGFIVELTPGESERGVAVGREGGIAAVVASKAPRVEWYGSRRFRRLGVGRQRKSASKPWSLWLISGSGRPARRSRSRNSLLLRSG